MGYRFKPLSSNYKVRVLQLSSETWPDIMTEQVETSWRGRSLEHSYAIVDGRGVFIGFIIASLHASSGSNLYIDYLALKPECRGCGIGDQIMKELTKDALDQKKSVHLYPYNHNESLIKWYKKYGFYESYDGYFNFHSYSTRSQAPIHTSLISQ